MDRTYERKKREESRWLRFVAREAVQEARSLRARHDRAMEEARRLLADRPSRNGGG